MCALEVAILKGDLASFTRSAKSIFFQAIIHFTIFNAPISELGACLAQNNMAKEQPKPGGVVKRLFECHLDEINQMEWRHRTVQNGDNEVRILGFFEEEFLKENLHFGVQ